ncbi:hypothetical protein Hanom_Chr01g00045331 [Helianthus anomalus]
MLFSIHLWWRQINGSQSQTRFMVAEVMVVIGGVQNCGYDVGSQGFLPRWCSRLTRRLR